MTTGDIFGKCSQMIFQCRHQAGANTVRVGELGLFCLIPPLFTLISHWATVWWGLADWTEASGGPYMSRL